MTYDPARHHRRTIRLPRYDYAQRGAYFVTLCLQRRARLLGTVACGEVRQSAYGKIVAEAWAWLAAQYPYVALDAWVVMPDHLHGIIVLDNAAGAPGQVKPLGQLVGAFKTVSTKQVNSARATPGAILWQRNYYERIIRNEDDLARVRQYIATNPARWRGQ